VGYPELAATMLVVVVTATVIVVRGVGRRVRWVRERKR
jgi:hypothetical protein